MGKKSFLRLITIYLMVICLGLPNGVLSVAWPHIRMDLGVKLGYMSIINIVLLLSSAIASFMNGKVISKIKIPVLLSISGIIIGISFLLYASVNSFYLIVLLSVPLGLAQGSIDSSSNVLVADEYSSKYMSWLHCFWALGASIGPMIMSYSIANHTWRIGYILIAIIHIVIAVYCALTVTSSLWKADNLVNQAGIKNDNDNHIGLNNTFSVLLSISIFFLYTGIELIASHWLSTVLQESRGLSVQISGAVTTILFIAITFGRFFAGVIINKVGNSIMLRLSIIIAIIGCAFIWLSSSVLWLLYLGTVLFGIGLAPIYPCLMHETPVRFSKEISKRLIGYQVGAGLLGGSVLSTLTGDVMGRISLELLFPIMLAILVILFFSNNYLQILSDNKNK